MARPANRIFDLGIAGFAAAAIGFAAFAMPEWRLYSLLQLTGLPDLLSAANPPLGLKARIGVAGLLAAGAFATVFVLMRLLDRVPQKRTAEEFDEEAEAVNLPIRLRRADAHPDNPARRPLIAGRELGEPFDELLLDVPAEPVARPEPEPVVAIQAPAPVAAGGLPSFLIAEEEPIVPPRAREDEPVDFLDPVAPPPARRTAPPTFQPVAFAAPEPIAPAPVAPPAVAAPIQPEPQIVASPVAVEPQAAPISIPAAPVQAAASRAGEESITDLMARLESGLRRRERTGAPAATPPSPSADDSIADRLRSAMSDLHRLAVRS